ncbi:MAG: DUF4435 domain-containing protein [Bacteroidota bacterium]
MKKQDITYQDKLNELKLDLSHPNSNGICFVLLEGETDIRLFRKFFNLENCKVENIPGGNPKLEMAVSELVKISELVIGIRDADFINLAEAPYSKTNIFLTDFHDIEMTLISQDDSMSSLIFEFTDIQKENHYLVREEIICTIEKVSLLKWLNYRENLEIVFNKTGFQDLLSFVNLRIDFDQYFSRLLSKSPNAKIVDIDIIKSKMTGLKALNPNPYQLCNGHDFTKTFSQFIREKGKTKDIDDVTLSSILRINCTKDFYYSTRLFASTKAWSESKSINIYG